MRFAETALGKRFESSPVSLTTVLAGALAFMFLVVCALLFSGGSVMRTVLCVLIAILPLAVYLVIKWPLIFPFAAYVCMVPLNEILYFSSFGTVSKLLGSLTFVALALWLARHREVVKPPVTVLVWLALTLWMTAGGMWAINRTDWLGDLTPGGVPGLLTFVQLLALYAIISVVPVRAIDWKAICAAIVTGGVAAAALSIFQFLRSSGFADNRLRLTGLSGEAVDPNHFAGALLLAVFVTTAAALTQKKPAAKLGLMLCLGVLMAGIYLSGSRDAVLAVAAGFLYLLWRGRHRAQLGLYMLVAALAAVPLLTALAARFTLLGSDSGAGRLFIWRVGLDALKTNWLLGAGLKNFPNAFDQAYLHVYQGTPTGYHYTGHDLLLTSAVELGLFGAGLMLAAWFSQFFMLKPIDRTSPLFDWRVALEAALLALFVSSLFLDNMFEKYTWLTFCVLALLRSRYITSVHEQSELGGAFAGPMKFWPRLDGPVGRLQFEPGAARKAPRP